MEMNLPNKLTLLRILMIPLFLVVLLSGLFPNPSNRYIAVGIFVIASLTDMLDGYIARSRNLVTNFGKFMDPLADKLLVSAAMIALIDLKELPSWVVILIISREFAITGFRTLAAEADVIIAAGVWGKIKTIVQMIMVIYLLIGLHGGIYDVIGSALILLAVVLTVISAVDYIMKNLIVLKG